MVDQVGKQEKNSHNVIPAKFLKKAYASNYYERETYCK